MYVHVTKWESKGHSSISPKLYEVEMDIPDKIAEKIIEDDYEKGQFEKYIDSILNTIDVSMRNREG